VAPLLAAAIGGWSIFGPESSILERQPSIVQESSVAKADRIPAELLRLSEESVVRIDGATGFVVDAGGLVMTCYHVADNEPDYVRFRDGTKAKILGVVAADRQNDLALLRIETNRKLVPLALAAALPSLGQELVMFNRSGAWDRPAVRGSMVSQIGAGVSSTHPFRAAMPVVRGCSGGPVVTLRGRVVGMASKGNESESTTTSVSVVAMRKFLAAAGSECHDLSVFSTADKSWIGRGLDACQPRSAWTSKTITIPPLVPPPLVPPRIVPAWQHAYKCPCGQRCTITRYRMDDGTVVDTDKASASWPMYIETTYPDGHNRIGKATRSRCFNETLYRSRKVWSASVLSTTCRFYMEQYSGWQGSRPHIKWVSNEEATRWLLAKGYDPGDDDWPKELTPLVDELIE